MLHYTLAGVYTTQQHKSQYLKGSKYTEYLHSVFCLYICSMAYGVNICVFDCRKTNSAIKRTLGIHVVFKKVYDSLRPTQ